MAKRWVKQLGRGMAVVMAVAQMSSMVAFAAPEDGQNSTQIGESEYEDVELVKGVTVTAIGDTKITPYFNEAFTLKVQVSKDDNGTYTYEWYKDFVANNNKLNNKDNKKQMI